MFNDFLNIKLLVVSELNLKIPSSSKAFFFFFFNYNTATSEVAAGAFYNSFTIVL